LAAKEKGRPSGKPIPQPLDVCGSLRILHLRLSAGRPHFCWATNF
jgi:hypothetical protein